MGSLGIATRGGHSGRLLLFQQLVDGLQDGWRGGMSLMGLRRTRAVAQRNIGAEYTLPVGGKTDHL